MIDENATTRCLAGIEFVFIKMSRFWCVATKEIYLFCSLSEQ
ncbi:hypothetical protein NC652_023716 [Populus alba x Populus x berolinensis]|uniref:Uncharacterized protein n=1 Tax=Populus alba x Populus x berolinensis TaxID=444605 RepID=A0AAD6QCW4_9ROSI|nr:hypothetical protein NC652_023716 [Populus alba x Populus x berolinensis]KAJ6985448.1 hypothetical protein NC653_023411 [Populus alba x Populus x berolinensis]